MREWTYATLQFCLNLDFFVGLYMARNSLFLLICKFNTVNEIIQQVCLISRIHAVCYGDYHQTNSFLQENFFFKFDFQGLKISVT